LKLKAINYKRDESGNPHEGKIGAGYGLEEDEKKKKDGMIKNATKWLKKYNHFLRL